MKGKGSEKEQLRTARERQDRKGEEREDRKGEGKIWNGKKVAGSEGVTVTSKSSNGSLKMVSTDKEGSITMRFLEIIAAQTPSPFGPLLALIGPDLTFPTALLAQ